MDPISLSIITALGRLGEQVIADAYQAVKAALQHHYGVESDLSQAVDKLEEKPTSQARQAVLQEELTTVQADQNPEILKTVDALRAALDALTDDQAAARPIITQTVTGDGNIFAGSGTVQVSR